VRRRRVVAGSVLVALVGVGLVVARGLPDSVATDVAGDALYAVAAYTALVLVWPRARRVVLAAVATGWCVAVELLQLSGLPADLAQHAPLVPLVLGSGFDPRDLAVYPLAVVVALAVDAGVSGLLLHGGRGGAGVGRRE